MDFPSTKMSEILRLGVVWLVALLISVALRFWGATHPAPVAIGWLTLPVLVFGPAFVLAVWLLLLRFGGDGESDDCDLESS
jgi:hypothetical protein